MYSDNLSEICYNEKVITFERSIFLDFTTNSGVRGTMFGVPHVVADNFLKLASGKQIKVLLYILRCSGRTVSDEEISRNTSYNRNKNYSAAV